MSDTTMMTCIRCGHETDCINGICQECIWEPKKKWAVPVEEWNKLVEIKIQLQEKLAKIKNQYSKDVCHIGFNCRIALCNNRPPEITNLMNSCLSCRMRETCRLLYGK